MAEIDLNLYSRQLYVLGLETLISLSKCNALLLGLRGVGVETAKNLILAGPQTVAVHDDDPVQLSDLSSQYYLTEADVGRKRSEVSAPKLAELNPYVKVRALSGEISVDLLKQFQVLVLTNAKSLAEIQKWNRLCREHGVNFIASDAYGLYGYVFVDFGQAFTVTDRTGEEHPQFVVSHITQGNPGLVTVHEDKRHGLETGESVVFEDVEGMSPLNDGKPREIVVKDPFTFEIKEDTSSYPNYISGFVRQAKVPLLLSFKSFDESLHQPGEFLLSDFGKFGRAEQLHVGLQALLAFRSENQGRVPSPYN